MSIKKQSIVVFILSLFVLVGCQKDDFEEVQESQNLEANRKGGSATTICGKTILKFNCNENKKSKENHKKFIENHTKIMGNT